MFFADAGPGCADAPGVSHLPDMDPLLYVGNEIAAAHGTYDVVISTVQPRDKNGRSTPHLTTHAVMFQDGQGHETRDGVEEARRCILEGARHVAAEIAAGKSVLVHCAWGQNRSCAICCAFAVLHRGFTAYEAIAYVRERNLATRRYSGQQPPWGAMHNKAFRQIITDIELERAARNEANSSVSTALQPAGGSSNA
jgi:hypothetical protein